MILISTSIPKSGSSFRFDIERELIAKKYGEKGQIQIEKYFKDNFSENFNFKKILIVLYVNFAYGSFALKTHSGPNKYLKLLLFFNMIKVTFSVRHPGDIILSAIDHDKREKKMNLQTGIQSFVDFETSLPLVKRFFYLYWKWQKYSILILRHEDFVTDLSNGISELNNYLKLNLDKVYLKEVKERFENSKTKHFNFNKGVLYRVFTDISEPDIKLMEHLFSDEIKSIGYPFYKDFNKI